MKIKLMSIEPRVIYETNEEGEYPRTYSEECYVYVVTEDDTIWFGRHLEDCDSIHFKSLKISFDAAVTPSLSVNSL